MALFLHFAVLLILATGHCTNAAVTHCNVLGGRCLKMTNCPNGMISLGTMFCTDGDVCCSGEVPCGNVPPPAARMSLGATSMSCSNPWQISLRRSLVLNSPVDKTDMTKSNHLCAGVLVHNEWVLTTAKCALSTFQTFPDYSGGALVAADHDLNVLEGREQFRTATEIHLNPNYHAPNAKQPSDTNSAFDGEYDYALIKVNAPFSAYGGEDCTTVICLPPSDTTIACDTTVQLHGWGPDIGSFQSAPIGKQMNVKLWDANTCKNFKLAMYFDTSPVHVSNLCYTSHPLSANAAVPCLGDAGGAVAKKMADGKYSLYGLLQTTFPCKNTTIHTVGDVVGIVNWIRSYTG